MEGPTIIYGAGWVGGYLCGFGDHVTAMAVIVRMGFGFSARGRVKKSRGA